MLTRWPTLVPTAVGNDTAAPLNLDFDEERSEGNVVAMPQLISVLAAIVVCSLFFFFFGDWGKFEPCVRRLRERKWIKVVQGFGGNLKVGFYWLKDGSNFFVIGPRGIYQSLSVYIR